MLSTIREKTQGWIAGIILGLLAIPFALWGINYYFEGGQPNVATVDGTAITVDSYRRALDEQRRSVTQMLGRNADPRLFDTPAFRERILDGLIDEILLAREVEKQGYRVSDAELAGQIRSAPQFQRDGKFDAQLYEALLRNAGLDARGFEARLRRDLLVRQSQSAFAPSGFATNADVEMLLRLQGQEREAAVAVLQPARLRERVRVGSAEIEQEYQAHPERYQTAERVRIEYLRLSVADLLKGVQVGDEELRQALADAGTATPGGSEERRASHILIPIEPAGDAAAEKAARAKADALRARLVAGADFAALARAESKDPGSAARGGDLGMMGRGVFVREFEEALFALKKPGELSAPVRTQYGVHLIKLTEIQKPKAQPKVDRAKVEAELRRRKAEERFFEMGERFQNLVYEQSDSLKPAAEALGLRIESSDWFTRTGGSGIAANPKVVTAAFDPEVLEQGRNSAAFELEPETMVAVRVTAHEPARVRPLGEVRADIERALTAAALDVEADKAAEAALARLLAGETTLEAVARETGMELQPARRYRRANGGEVALIEALFKAPRPETQKPVFGSARLADGRRALFALREVIEPTAVATGAAEAAAVRRAIENRRGAGHYDAYRAGLRADADIEIFRDQL
jgi:peptidyl-prolyl cis-trans isomerase D